PASVNPPRNLRRLNRLSHRVRMGTSLPDAGQCNPRTPARFSGNFAQYQRLQGTMTDVISLRRQPVNNPHLQCSLNVGHCVPMGNMHIGVIKAPLCNSGLSVSHLTEGCETTELLIVTDHGGTKGAHCATGKSATAG